MGKTKLQREFDELDGLRDTLESIKSNANVELQSIDEQMHQISEGILEDAYDLDNVWLVDNTPADKADVIMENITNGETLHIIREALEMYYAVN